MKVLLSVASWDLWEQEEDNQYPVGLACLGAILDKNGHESSLLDLTCTRFDKVENEVKEKIRREDPDIFGISILTNSRVATRRLLEIVKKIKPEIKIIAGGVHTHQLYEQVLNNYPIDFIVLGEGDLTMVELVDAIEKKKPLKEFKKIKGIVYKDNGEIIKTEPRERIKDLDILPIPKHEFFEDIIKKFKTGYIMSSRGCVFHCTFCSSTPYWGRCISVRSPKKTVEELEYLLKKYPFINKVIFLDSEFVFDSKRIKEICKIMIEKGIKIKWVCCARASSITDDLVSLMKKAGCVRMDFGVESGSQRILNGMRKGITVEQIINSFRICKKYDIEARCLTIMGMPGENKESVKETIKLLKKIKTNTGPAILIVYPNTEIYELAKKNGLLTDDYWLTDKLPPLYTVEHSKFKLWWWSFKIEFMSNIYDKDRGDIFECLSRRIFRKLKPHNFFRVFRRYVSDKS